MPPHVKQSWDDNTPAIQGHIIAYQQLREYEEMELQTQLAKARVI